MALSLTGTLADEWLELDAELRQQSFFDYLPSTLEVWGLTSDQGWVMSVVDHNECLFLWTHELLAKRWLEKNHPEAQPQCIRLHEFKETWLPGLKKNNIKLLIGASATHKETIVMTVDEFIDELS